MRVCRAQQPCPRRQASTDSGGFRARIRSFPPGVVGPQAAKEHPPTRCAWVLGMEKKSGSGPKRNWEQLPSSLLRAAPSFRVGFCLGGCRRALGAGVGFLHAVRGVGAARGKG